MTFTELPFMLMFLLVYPLWWYGRGRYRTQVGLLLLSSLIFYGYDQKWLLLLLVVYCVVDWWVGCAVERSPRRKLILTLGVTFNLVVLAYWKYTPLLLRSAAGLLGFPDLPWATAATESWAIPFGISFYAFTGIAYMVDVYRGDTPAERNFLRYTLWAVFFPHLVAGPILRPGDLLTKLRPDTLPHRPEAPLEAVLLLGRGFFKKMVLADRIALAIDPFFLHVADASTAGVWALPYVWLYALQIYFDFSGYTDIARGLGLLFGFRWPDNFNLPYLATSVQDFWRRWHITLSLFLRDYLYIPLGGSRGRGWRTNLNLMLTMLLGGLWHGASWSFLGWGGLHGLFLVAHRYWSQTGLAARLQALTGLRRLLWQALALALTFHCVCLAWCFFRLTVLAHSLACVRKWFVFDPTRLFVGGSDDVSLWLLLGLYGLLALAARRCGQLPALSGFGVHARPIPLARGFLWGGSLALLVLALLLSPGGEKPPFIYFQF
jgi:alginate O-acetyltransferase complex protein AlgI